MLSVSGLDVAYGESQVLWAVDLEVGAGELVCLMGRNGVGKTTLLKTAMGLLPARRGRVRFDGADVTGWSPDRRARAGIGYVPQGREIFPHLTVEENLRMALLGCGRTVSLAEPLALFPALRPLLGRKGGVLSGGEQQMLAIGRALLTRPKLLMLDEPTEGIQPSIILEIEDALRRIKRELGLAVLLVMVLIPSLGVAAKGARRWLRLGPISVQPAEMAKLITVIYLAAYLAWFGPEKLLRWFLDFGTVCGYDKLLYGSENSHTTVYPAMMAGLNDVAARLGLPQFAPADMEKIMWRNTARLWKIKVPERASMHSRRKEDGK